MRRIIDGSAVCFLFLAITSGAQTTVTTSGGTANAVPMFTGPSTLGTSAYSFVSGALIGNGLSLTVGDTFTDASYSLSNYGLSWEDFSGGTLGPSVVLSGWGGVNLYTDGTRRFTITNSGNIGIGTKTPSASLEVDGNVKLTSGSGASITFADGTVQSTAYTGVTCGGDYAESVDVTGSRTKYEPGDVLVLDTENPGRVLKSVEAYSTTVSGIYSTKPGVVGRRQTTDPRTAKTEVPMAMVGVVPTNVSAENGAIRVGDLLVSSSIAGYAMKGTDRSKMLGAVIGKAMGNLNAGTGVIEVLVTLQ